MLPSLYWNQAYWTKPGEMRHPIVIEQKSTTRGTMGEQVDSWSTFVSCWAKIWPVKGREASESRRETGKVATRFNTRFLQGITPGMRLKYGTRYFDIIAAINIGELNREIEITAEETI